MDELVAATSARLPSRIRVATVPRRPRSVASPAVADRTSAATPSATLARSRRRSATAVAAVS